MSEYCGTMSLSPDLLKFTLQVLKKLLIYYLKVFLVSQLILPLSLQLFYFLQYREFTDYDFFGKYVLLGIVFAINLTFFLPSWLVFFIGGKYILRSTRTQGQKKLFLLLLMIVPDLVILLFLGRYANFNVFVFASPCLVAHVIPLLAFKPEELNRPAL
jgi:hypothetical protein